MKKLFLLLTAVLLTAISANIFAQTNIGTEPSVGSTHYYWVNSTDTAVANHTSAGNSYTWWISKDAADLIAVESEGEFTVEHGVYNESTTNNFSIGLTWNPTSANETYYLVVKETDSDGNQCSNLKAVAIQPQNNFELIFAAIDEDQATLGDSLDRCAPDIALSASGVDITYDYGVDSMVFKLTSLDLYTSWSFAYTFENTLGDIDDSSIEYQVGGTDAGSWTTLPASPVTISENSAGTEDVYIRVVVDNGDTNGDYEEGVDGQEIKLTLSSVQDAGNNAATTIYTSDGVTPFESAASATQTQTVNARPNTSDIGFN